MALFISLDNFLGLLKFSSNVLWIPCFPPGSFFLFDYSGLWLSCLRPSCPLPLKRELLRIWSGSQCEKGRAVDGGMHCIESCAEPAFSKLEPLNFTEVPLSLCPSAYAHARAPTHSPTWADQFLPRGKKSFPGSILYSGCCHGQLGRGSETETPPLGTFIVSQSCGLAEAGWGACLHSLSWCGGHRDPPVLCLEFLRLRIFSLLSSPSPPGPSCTRVLPLWGCCQENPPTRHWDFPAHT